MADVHTVCCGCGRRTPEIFKNSFSKRLLVAVSVVIIVAMCLNTAEARAMEPRRRHQRTRHSQDMAQITKEHSSIEQYKNATRKIKHKLRNTKRFFDQEKRVLKNETRDYRDGMPVWLPTVNFVDIHFHDYKLPRKNGRTVTEKKFKYLMPRLFKNLKEYEEIFKLLLNMQVDVKDDPFNSYLAIRRKLLKDTLDRLSGTIEEIYYNMVTVKMAAPHFDKSRMKVDALQKKVDATQCLKNDHIALRGYGNLLHNWYEEFRCPLNKKNGKCRAFQEKMTQKRNNKKKHENRNMSIS